MIYFIQPKAGGPIKIGTTVRLGQRLKQLAAESGAELQVLAVVDGGFREEKSLHQRFAHLRQVGEWFEPGDDLLGFIVNDGKPWDSTIGSVKNLNVWLPDALMDRFEKLLGKTRRTKTAEAGLMLEAWLEKHGLWTEQDRIDTAE